MSARATSTAPAGILHDCAVDQCTTSHAAWRYFVVDASDERPLGAPYISLQTGRHMGWPARESILAQCHVNDDPDHEAPDPDCSCGVRIAFHLPALASMILSEHRYRHGLPDHAVADYGGRFDDAFLDRIAVGKVGTVGRIAGRSGEDHAGVFRVTRAQVFGPVLLPASLASARHVIADVYSVDVEVRKTRGLPWLASMLPAGKRRTCQACGSRTLVRDGLCCAWQQCFQRVRDRRREGGSL